MHLVRVNGCWWVKRFKTEKLEKKFVNISQKDFTCNLLKLCICSLNMRHKFLTWLALLHLLCHWELPINQLYNYFWELGASVYFLIGASCYSFPFLRTLSVWNTQVWISIINEAISCYCDPWDSSFQLYICLTYLKYYLWPLDFVLPLSFQEHFCSSFLETWKS